MNKISPDEQTAQRIEQAVLQKAAKPSKKKKPFYVYAGAFSGAAACIVGAILLINFNINTSKNHMINAAENHAGASVSETAESLNAPQDLTENYPGAANEGKHSADGAQDQALEPTAPMENFGNSANTKSEGGFDMAQEASVNPRYTLEFQPDKSIIVYNGKTEKKYIPYGSVERYSQEQQDLISAKTSDGKTVLIMLKNDYLYVFENDLKTAVCYKLSN